MKPLQLTREQQQEFAEKMNDELEKVTMSWDGELRDWYVYAIDALDYARTPNLRIQQTEFRRLFQTTVHGINMNVIAHLCNNLESRSAKEMGVTGEGMCDILELNNRVALRWKALTKPVEEKLYEYFKAENNKARLLSGTQAGLSLIKGEA